MRAKTWTIGTILMAGILVISVGAMAQMSIPAADQGKAHSRAAEHSPVIDKEPNGDLVLNPPGLEKIVFIHYKKGFGKPPWAGGGAKEKESKCYDFLGKGLKWDEADLPINYIISSALDSDPIRPAVEEWDYWTGSEVFGSYDYDDYASWDADAPDGRNELVFGNYPEHGVIAVTVIWGYFSGPPSGRKIVEFDILFDTDYVWGDVDLDSSVMDIQNIATHEIGHGLGLADLYETACSTETMYGYSQEGEIKKRDLNDGDKTGIQELYGAP